MELKEIGEPEDVAALVVYLLSERAREERITGQVYTIAGPKIAVWAQPRELRAAYAEGAWTPERIADFLPGTVGLDPMPMLAPAGGDGEGGGGRVSARTPEGSSGPAGDRAAARAAEPRHGTRPGGQQRTPWRRRGLPARGPRLAPGST